MFYVPPGKDLGWGLGSPDNPSYVCPGALCLGWGHLLTSNVTSVEVTISSTSTWEGATTKFRPFQSKLSTCGTRSLSDLLTTHLDLIPRVILVVISLSYLVL